MTPHEEAAKETVELFMSIAPRLMSHQHVESWRADKNCDICQTSLDKIKVALASAEKKGREEGFARGQEKKASCVCDEATKTICGLHQPMMEKWEKRSWNQAIEEAVKVVESRCRELRLQFGCDGQHHGIGTKDCPRELHHHHDDRCVSIASQLEKLKRN